MRGPRDIDQSLALLALPEFSEAVLALRSWERAQIPLFTPQIALDILLHAAACELRNKLASIKNIHLAIGYSQDRIREVLRELVDGGWIEVIPDEQDGRSRLAKPTRKALDLIESYKERIDLELASRIAAQRQDISLE